jgi:hypothetical protein
VVWRGVGDLRSVPDDDSFVAGEHDDRNGAPGSQAGSRSENRSEGLNGFSGLVVEGSDVLAPNTRFRVATTSRGSTPGSPDTVASFTSRTSAPPTVPTSTIIRPSVPPS